MWHVARRGMVLSSSKRTIALAGFAADRRKRGFSVAVSPGDQASPSVLEEGSGSESPTEKHTLRGQKSKEIDRKTFILRH